MADTVMKLIESTDKLNLEDSTGSKANKTHTQIKDSIKKLKNSLKLLKNVVGTTTKGDFKSNEIPEESRMFSDKLELPMTTTDPDGNESRSIYKQ